MDLTHIKKLDVCFSSKPRYRASKSKKKWNVFFNQFWVFDFVNEPISTTDTMESHLNGFLDLKWVSRGPKISHLDPGGTPGGPPIVDFANFCTFSDLWWLGCLGTPSEWIPRPRLRIVGPRYCYTDPGRTPGGPPIVDFATFCAFSDPLWLRCHGKPPEWIFRPLMGPWDWPYGPGEAPRGPTKSGACAFLLIFRHVLTQTPR